MLKQKAKYSEINPETYFEDWKYDIQPYHWLSLGVSYRYYINLEKTKEARNAAINNGVEKSRINDVKIFRGVHVLGNPPNYEFLEGSLFRNKVDGCWLQIVTIRTPSQIEVHIGDSKQRKEAYHLSEQELRDFLKSGIPPLKNVIYRSQSFDQWFPISTNQGT